MPGHLEVLQENATEAAKFQHAGKLTRAPPPLTDPRRQQTLLPPLPVGVIDQSLHRVVAEGAPVLTPGNEPRILICMSKRLQVLLEEPELKEIRRAARRRRMTVAEWVRQALRVARAAETGRDAASKLEAVRTAARFSFPSGDIDAMLAEIERGYRDESR